MDSRVRSTGVTRRGFLGLAGAGAAFVLAGCSAQDASATGAGGKTVLKWAPGSSPWSWDPVVQGSGFQFNQLSLVYASLTEIDEDGAAVPGLAESWDYNEAGDQVTFHLREGLVFHDGEPLDAAAVKAYIERAQSQSDSALDGDLTSIGAITAEGDRDVVISLTQVDYQIPLLLGRRVALITSPKASPDELTTAPVGAGPFVVTELVPESHATFEKNPDYWDADNIHIDRVELHWGIDPSSVVSAVQTGVYNFASLVPSQGDSAEKAGIDVSVHPGFNAANVSINNAMEPFTDSRVLDAVRHAINREEFVTKITFGYGSATAQPFPEGFVAWSDDVEDPWPYDPVKAREILADAGYDDGDIVLDFAVRDDNPANEIVRSQLGAVGIVANLRVEPNWEEPFFSKRLPISTYSTTGRESPVQTLTAHFGPEGPLNLSPDYTSDEFQTALTRARETPLDSPDYAKNLQAATAAGVRTSPTIFTYSLPNIFVSNGVSRLPQIPGQIHWSGVTLGE